MFAGAKIVLAGDTFRILHKRFVQQWTKIILTGANFILAGASILLVFFFNFYFLGTSVTLTPTVNTNFCFSLLHFCSKSGDFAKSDGWTLFADCWWLFCHGFRDFFRNLYNMASTALGTESVFQISTLWADCWTLFADCFYTNEVRTRDIAWI